MVVVQEGFSALTYAATHGQLSALKEILKIGAGINLKAGVSHISLFPM